MKPVLVLVLLAAFAPPAQAAPAAQIQVRTTTFEANATTTPQLVKVDCQAGERAVGGGYTLPAQGLWVTGSYPADTSWIVEVINSARKPVPLDISVSCLSGGTAEAIAVSASSDRVTCPSGTMIVGGGYQGRGVTVTGSVINSYPGLSDSWVAEGPSITKVFGLCVRGAVAKRFAVSTVNAVAGSGTCAQEPATTAVCFYPRTGSQTLTCADGEVLTMGGHRLVSGTMPPYAILTSNTDGRMWTFRLSGSSRDSKQLAIEAIAVCLRLTAAEVITNPTRVDLSWPVVGGAALLLLLLMILIIALILRMRRQRTPSAAAPQLEAVLTGQRTSLRHDSFREVL